MRRPLVTLSFFTLTIAAAVAPALADGDGQSLMGTWARSDRSCASATASKRTYTPTVVTTGTVANPSKCPVVSIEQSGETIYLTKDCPRASGRTLRVFETVRVLSPTTMRLTSRTNRLKLTPSRRYNRCPA